MCLPTTVSPYQQVPVGYSKLYNLWCTDRNIYVASSDFARIISIHLFFFRIDLITRTVVSADGWRERVSLLRH
jgi:hypothetical protein